MPVERPVTRLKRWLPTPRRERMCTKWKKVTGGSREDGPSHARIRGELEDHDNEGDEKIRY